jgi:hypothetical protein
MAIDLDAALKKRKSEVEEINNSILNIPVTIENLTWTDFCNLEGQNFLKCIQVDLTPPVDPEQILIGEKYSQMTSLHVSTTSHKIPHIKESTMVIRSTPTGILLVEKIKSRDDVYGIKSFIPFDSDLKKVVGYFKKIRHEHYYHITILKPGDEVTNIIPPDVEPRNTDEEITENDKLMLLNFNAKFKKMAENFRTLNSIFTEINSVMVATIDPIYIARLMTLNYQISYGKYI